MASDAATATVDKPLKRNVNSQPDTKRHRSIFDLPSGFFDSCRLLPSPAYSINNYVTPQNDDVQDESFSERETIEDNDDIKINEKSKDDDDGRTKAMQRWSCNTCKAEFESLQDQRFHFKSDLHRFNIKLSIAGKDVIREKEFDEAASDSLCKDYDVSSISGSEDEDENNVTNRGRESHLKKGGHESNALSRSKIFMQLQNGDRVSIWRCLVVHDSETILLESDNLSVMDDADTAYFTHQQVIDKLKYIAQEPRDSTHLRIVLLARGGHFAGGVFDGNSVVAHKTFHRYVVRAKAGKKQSSKDAGGRGIHSAGASLRRYNELALKKDIQELLDLWRPYLATASCIFIHAPSNNRQLLFDGEKPHFACQHNAIRNVPLTVRRPTFKEARRIYNLLVEISPEIPMEIALDAKEESLNNSNCENNSNLESSEMIFNKNIDITTKDEAYSIVNEMDGLSILTEPKEETDNVCITTPLHEAAKCGDAPKVLQLLDEGLNPCIKDERGQTPYELASDKEVRNTIRRFMASNMEKWDWHAAKVPSPLTKEMEEAQTAKQAERDAKKKAKAKELKKLRRAKEKEKKVQEEAAKTGNTSSVSMNSKSNQIQVDKGQHQLSGFSSMTKEEQLKKLREAEREKRALAAERRITEAAKNEGSGSSGLASASQSNHTNASNVLCSCCNVSLAGKVPFHRYHYKYCSTSCMHVHREFLEEDG